MSDLAAQRRLAADELDVGKSRVWLNPEAQDELADAITREDIREQIDQGHIREKAGGRQNTKSDWIARIRAQRARLKELRDDGPLNSSQYRELYNKASGGEFEDVRRLNSFIENNYDVTLEDD